MSDQFQKWISDKNFEICDKIDETFNKNNNELISIKNDFLKTQDIKVFLSKQSVIESIVANTSITKANNTNVFKWFNDINFRKDILQKFSDLLTESEKVVEYLETILSKTAIKISRKRVQNLLKTLNYSINNDIYNYFNEYNFKSIEYSIIKVFKTQSFVLKMIYEVTKCLISGIPIVMIAEEDSALFAAYVLDLLKRAGLQSGVINLVIIDNKNALKLAETTEPINSPVFVILESADIDSAVDRVIHSSVTNTIDSLNVFVQQSVYKKFCDRIKTRSTNSLEIGDKFDTNVDIISKININYDAIDFDNENKSFEIQIFKFRTNAELKSLVNHFTRIPYISFWAEKTSLALELAKVIESSSLMFINGSLKYPLKVQNSVFDKVFDKIEWNHFFGQKSESFEQILNSYKKWKTISPEERLRIIRHFLIKNETKVKVNPLAVDVFDQKLAEIKDNYGTQLIITDFQSIGVFVINIDKEFNEKTFALILEALISGNTVLISSNKTIDDLIKFNQYLSSLGQNILKFTAISEQQIKGNKILSFGGNSIGIYLEDIETVSRNSFIKFNKSITLSMGDISFAK